MKSKFWPLFLALLIGPHSLIWAQSNQLQIESFKTSGNGCPAGTYTWLLSGDRQTLEILFNNFTAQRPGQPTKSCNVSLDVAVPPGHAVSWYRTEHRGFVDTTGGATGEFSARYFLQGAGGFDTEKNQSWQPNSVEDYLIINDNPSSSWSRCGGKQKMSVHTQLKIKGGDGMLSLDSESHRAETVLHFAFKPC